jgi:hypothetical protein
MKDKTKLKTIILEDYTRFESWYEKYDITIEKIDLFYDFLSDVSRLLITTYPGDDVMDSQEHRKNHFTWCWDKIIDQCSKEDIHFNKRGVHYEYFWVFISEILYEVDENVESSKILSFLKTLFYDFDLSNEKSKGIMITIYKILDKNLKI